MAVRLSALRAGRPLHQRKIRGTHFCQRLSRTQGHSAAGNIRSILKPNNLIGNRTRDLPTCSIVPQPTMLRGTPCIHEVHTTPRCLHAQCIPQYLISLSWLCLPEIQIWSYFLCNFSSPLLTNSTQVSPAWEANCCLAIPEITSILCISKVHRRIHEGPFRWF
jgi:hypothetical protein